MSFSANVAVCHKCPADQRRCITCTGNGRSIDVNSAAAECPFGLFPGLPASPKLPYGGEPCADRPVPAPSDWPTRGPALWADLHRAALAGNLTPEWLAAFRLRIGCGECLRHWDAEAAAHPPDLGIAEAAWEWTWARHNSVNRRLGRPEMSLRDAATRWT